MNGTCVTLLNPVDEGRYCTLAKLGMVAKAQGTEILLLGAFARDLLFWHMHSVVCHRATMDVDVVVQMKSWDDYNDFRAALLAAGFTGEEKEHPEKLCDPETNVEVDLLPFGEIADDGKTVVWPQDNSRWSVVGIQESYDHALKIQITVSGGATHDLRFVSAPALVLLKIVAVYDRPEARYKKDTVDIGFVIQEYLGIGNRERLRQSPHSDIMNNVSSDLNRATACLLGRDIRGMVTERTRMYVVDLLSKEAASQSPCRFTQGLQRSLCQGNFSAARTIVNDILNGLKWNTQ